MSNILCSEPKQASLGRHLIRKHLKGNFNFAERLKEAFDERYKCEKDWNPQKKGKRRQEGVRTSAYPLKLLEENDNDYMPKKEQVLYKREKTQEEDAKSERERKQLISATENLEGQVQSDPSLQKQKSCLKRQNSEETSQKKKEVKFSSRNQEKLFLQETWELEELKEAENEEENEDMENVDEDDEYISEEDDQEGDELIGSREECQNLEIDQEKTKSNQLMISGSPLNSTGSDFQKQLRAVDSSIPDDQNIRLSLDKLDKTENLTFRRNSGAARISLNKDGYTSKSPDKKKILNTTEESKTCVVNQGPNQCQKLTSPFATGNLFQYNCTGFNTHVNGIFPDPKQPSNPLNLFGSSNNFLNLNGGLFNITQGPQNQEKKLLFQN